MPVLGRRPTENCDARLTGRGVDMFVARASAAYILRIYRSSDLTRSPIQHKGHSGATSAAQPSYGMANIAVAGHHSSPHVCHVLHDDERPRRMHARSHARFHSVKRARSRRNACMVLRLQLRITPTITAPRRTSRSTPNITSPDAQQPDF